MWTPELLFLRHTVQSLRGRIAFAIPDDAGGGDEAPAVAMPYAFPTVDDDTLPIAELAARYGLDGAEQDALLFAACARLEPSLAASIAALSEPVSVDFPTPFAWLRLAALGEPARYWALQYIFAPSARLRRHGLLELWPRVEGADDVLRAELVVPSDILGMLRGDRWLDERLARYASLIAPLGEQATPALPLAVGEQLEGLVMGHGRHDYGPTHRLVGGLLSDLVIVSGRRGVGKTAAVRWACRHTGTGVIALQGALLAHAQPAEMRDIIRLAVREAELHAEVLLVDPGEPIFAADGPGAPALVEALSQFRALVFVIARDSAQLHPLVRSAALAWVELPFPDFAAGAAIWELGKEAYQVAGPPPEELAERFPLDGRQILHAARLAALEEAADEAPPDALGARLGRAALAQLDDALGELAVVQRSSLDLEDLVVDDTVRDQIEEIVAAFRNRRRLYEDWGFGHQIHRGRGLICLLDGDPGTGKTHTAEVLAGTLGLKLVRVNTGQIIDKYIGETEKRLADLFVRTHPGMDLLLFDEADSLFGKRTKVERSTDRYANAAINVLLQLVEHYEGLVVLTTNLKQDIDPAFERRFSFRIRYPMPGAAERERIWRRLLPVTAPLGEEVDFELLSHDLELSGGGIKNAVVRAGYLALRAGTDLTMEHLLESGYRELASSGKLVRQDWE